MTSFVQSRFVTSRHAGEGRHPRQATRTMVGRGGSVSPAHTPHLNRDSVCKSFPRGPSWMPAFAGMTPVGPQGSSGSAGTTMEASR